MKCASPIPLKLVERDTQNTKFPSGGGLEEGPSSSGTSKSGSGVPATSPAKQHLLDPVYQPPIQLSYTPILIGSGVPATSPTKLHANTKGKMGKCA